MKVKDFVHEAFDINRGLFKTFVALFIDPKRVITHPNEYMKPWQYAMYVVSISCLFLWFVIHLLADPIEQQVLWAMPKRVLNLTNGFISFYETSQPIKRLLIGEVALYVPLLIIFFKHREKLVAITLLVLGHAIFIAFIIEAVRILILGKGVMDSGDALIAIIARFAYQTYASYRIFDQKWFDFWKAIVIFIIFYALYSPASTFGVHGIYYGVMNRSNNFYDVQPGNIQVLSRTLLEAPIAKADNSIPPLKLQLLKSEVAYSTIRTHHHGFGQVVANDSVLFSTEYFSPAGEVAKVMVTCFSRNNFSRLWSTIIFEKIDRYSPDSSKIFLIPDSVKNNVIACYRIANNRNTSVHLVSINAKSGKINYYHNLDIQADDLEINDIVMDESSLFVCGSAKNMFRNFDLGMILKMDRGTGQMKSTQFLGEDSFASHTSFEKIKLSDSQIRIILKRDFKKLIYFQKTEWAELIIKKGF